jgi:hypothetical protein
MAGRSIIPASEYPDIITMMCQITTVVDPCVVLVPDVPVIVDAAWFAAGSGAAGAITARLLRGVYTATSEDAIGEMVTAARALTDNVSVQGSSVAVPRTNWTINVAENLIEAGNFLILDFSGSTTGLGNGVLVGLRLRTRM